MKGKFTIDSDILGKWNTVVENKEPCVTEFSGKADFTFKGLAVYDFLFGSSDAFRLNLTPDARNILPIPIYYPYVN